MEQGTVRNSAFGGYGRGPREMIRDANLSTNARLLWIILDDMTSGESPQPFPGQQRLAEWMGCSVSSVRRSTQELSDAGWLKSKQRGLNKTNVYTLTRPNTAKQADRSPVSDPEASPVSDPDRSPVSDKAKPEEAEPEEATTTTVSNLSSEPTEASGGGRNETPTAILTDSLAALGYTNRPKPQPGELKTIELALKRGHTPDTLLALAWRPSVQNADKPRRALIGAFGNLANREPEPLTRPNKWHARNGKPIDHEAIERKLGLK